MQITIKFHESSKLSHCICFNSLKKFCITIRDQQNGSL